MSCSPVPQSADPEVEYPTLSGSARSDFGIRPLHAEDREAEARFLEKLSYDCRRYRFLGQMSDSAGLLARGCTQFEFEPDTSFAAFAANESGNEIAGIARYGLNADGSKCECAVTLADRWANPDLGLRLMLLLIELSGEREIRSLYSINDLHDAGMRDMAGRLGFQTRTDPFDSRLCIHRLDLPVQGAEIHQ